MGDILIKNGLITDSAGSLGGVNLDILLVNGVIKEIGTNIGLPVGGEVIDATGKIVCNSLCDMHTHLRWPGQSSKEDLVSGTKAAIAGGFTDIACMPNTDPVVDSFEVVDMIKSKLEIESYCRVYPIGAISSNLRGNILSNILNSYYEGGKMNGVVAVSDDGKSVMNGRLMKKAMDIMRECDKPVISHCEDIALVNGGLINDGKVSKYLNLKGISNASEYKMIVRDIELAKITGCRLHIAHVSTKEGVLLIREAKEKGFTNITAEVTPHHLALNETNLYYPDTNYKVNPPLRSELDRLALIEGVRDGFIDVIASDHAPHNVYEKGVDFDAAPFGCIGLETSLPTVIETLYYEHNISLNCILEKMIVNPRKILGLTNYGLKLNKKADIIVIDIDKYYKVDPWKFNSLSHNCPLNYTYLRGWPEIVIKDGCVVYDKSLDWKVFRGEIL